MPPPPPFPPTSMTELWETHSPDLFTAISVADYHHILDPLLLFTRSHHLKLPRHLSLVKEACLDKAPKCLALLLHRDNSYLENWRGLLGESLLHLTLLKIGNRSQETLQCIDILHSNLDIQDMVALSDNRHFTPPLLLLSNWPLQMGHATPRLPSNESE